LRNYQGGHLQIRRQGQGHGQGCGGDIVALVLEFTAISKDQPYRAPRVTPQPIIRGPQTATVAGPEGEKVFTDKYGRVKFQFHWDRYEQQCVLRTLEGAHLGNAP